MLENMATNAGGQFSHALNAQQLQEGFRNVALATEQGFISRDVGGLKEAEGNRPKFLVLAQQTPQGVMKQT